MKRPLLLTLVASFLLPACGASREAAFAAASPQSPSAAPAAEARRMAGAPSPAMYSQAPVPAAAPLAAKTSPSVAPPARGADAATAIPSASVHAPLVTYSGEIALKVDRDPAATIDQIITAAEALGGYLASRRDASVEVRVPSARFREAMTMVEPLGEVTHRSVAATDVSDEFHDAEVRLANLRATRNRLQELLAKTGSLMDTLTVERELERVAQEIDRLEGRLEYLKSRVAFSSLVVSVEARPKSEPLVVAKKDKRAVDLPVKWLDEMGTDRLLTLR